MARVCSKLVRLAKRRVHWGCELAFRGLWRDAVEATITGSFRRARRLGSTLLPSTGLLWLALGGLAGCEAESGESNSSSHPREVAPAQAEPLPQNALDEMAIFAEHKRNVSSEQGKLATALRIEIERRDSSSPLSQLPHLESRVRPDERDRVRVDIDAKPNSPLDEALVDLGASIVSRAPGGDRIRAWVPVSALYRLAAEPAVRRVRPALDAMTRKDDTSEGDTAHRADVIRANLGIDGAGITIGVVSDGIDALQQVLDSGDLSQAAAPQVIPGQAGEGSEGTAMLEIVYDLAPGATLWFAAAGDSQQQMADNIRALADVGCDIIVDDILFLDEATFQDDVLSQAVTEVVERGVLYFSASGNSGSLAKGTSGTYEADYVAADAQPPPVSDYPMNDWLDVHAFDAGLNYDSITVDPPVLVALEWADPLDIAANDYDLFLLTPDRQSIVGIGADAQNGTGDPMEFVLSEFTDDTDNTLVVARWLGDDRFIRLSTHRGELAVGTDGQINGHAAVPGAFAISAVDAYYVFGEAFTGGAANPVEAFASDGPRRMFFEPDGTPFTPGNLSATGGVVRQKPDFTAADGVTTTTPGFAPFFGTSAAAPHAAALAALVLQSRPDILELEGLERTTTVRQLFAETALDIETPGFDVISGFGLVMADAVSAGCAGLEEGADCDDVDACTENSVCQSGTCVGTPVVCEAFDECHSAGECNPETGQCENPSLPDGTSCDDGDACSLESSCMDGACEPNSVVLCPDEDACYEASNCEVGTGLCLPQERKADESGCDDDEDGVPNASDLCPEDADSEQLDNDGDELGDVCDPDDDDDGVDDTDELAMGTDPFDPDDVTGAGGASSGGSGNSGEGGGSNDGPPGDGGVPGLGGSGGRTAGGAGDTGSAGEEAAAGASGEGDGGGLGGAAAEAPSKFAGAPSVEPESQFEPQTSPSTQSDASPDAPPPTEPGGQTDGSGCGCRVQGAPSTSGLAALGLCLVALGWRWRKRATFRRGHRCVGMPNGAC
jgi:MYXO-CTERM domain-containing protein